MYLNGQYLFYLPVKDERLSRPETTQVNDLPRVATEVPVVVQDVSCLSWLYVFVSAFRCIVMNKNLWEVFVWL